MVVRRNIIASIIIFVMIMTTVAIMPEKTNAASAKTVSYTYTVTKGGSDCKIWAKDTISFKVANGRIVSKPKVVQQTSAASKIIGMTKLAKYAKQKEPKISYKYNATTGTVTTYWIMTTGVSVSKLSVDCSKTASVTYSLSGTGKVKVVKKQSSKFTCFK